MRWFPTGTELKGMKTSEFEKLFRDAGETLRCAEARPPRLLKATHEARWQDGRLVGKSSFVIETNPASASASVLEPWSPAVDVSPDAAGAVRSDADGHTLLWVPPNPGGVTPPRWIGSSSAAWARKEARSRWAFPRCRSAAWTSNFPPIWNQTDRPVSRGAHRRALMRAARVGLPRPRTDPHLGVATDGTQCPRHGRRGLRRGR